MLHARRRAIPEQWCERKILFRLTPTLQIVISPGPCTPAVSEVALSVKECFRKISESIYSSADWKRLLGKIGLGKDMAIFKWAMQGYWHALVRLVFHDNL